MALKMKPGSANINNTENINEQEIRAIMSGLRILSLLFIIAFTIDNYLVTYIYAQCFG